MLEVQRVGDGGDHRVFAEDLDALALATRRVALADEVAGRLVGRAGAAPGGNSICIAAVSVDAGELAQLALERH